MALNYEYNFAEVDNDSRMCIGVMTTSNPNEEGPTPAGTTYVAIPVYDPEYILKYYIDGNWYEDAEGTIPWQSALL